MNLLIMWFFTMLVDFWSGSWKHNKAGKKSNYYGTLACWLWLIFQVWETNTWELKLDGCLPAFGICLGTHSCQSGCIPGDWSDGASWVEVGLCAQMGKIQRKIIIIVLFKLVAGGRSQGLARLCAVQHWWPYLLPGSIFPSILMFCLVPSMWSSAAATIASVICEGADIPWHLW